MRVWELLLPVKLASLLIARGSSCGQAELSAALVRAMGGSTFAPPFLAGAAPTSSVAAAGTEACTGPRARAPQWRVRGAAVRAYAPRNDSLPHTGHAHGRGQQGRGRVGGHASVRMPACCSRLAFSAPFSSSASAAAGVPVAATLPSFRPPPAIAATTTPRTIKITSTPTTIPTMAPVERSSSSGL